MIISRLILKNWRNFRRIDIALGDRVFIVGPNASGKSNLLDAIRFLREIAKPGGGLQNSLAIRGGLSKVRCLAARKEPDVELEVYLSEDGTTTRWRYAVGFTHQAGGKNLPVVKFERVWDRDTQVLSRPDKEDLGDKVRLTQTHLEQISANSTFRDIAKFLESVRYIHLVPQLLRKSDVQGGLVTDDPFGRGFLELVAKTTTKTRDARLKKVEDELRKAIPQMKNLSFTRDESGIPHLEVIYQHWRPNAGIQREDQFSDGTLRMIGLFWSLLDGDAPLLLEEPELSINAAIVRSLPSTFERLQQQQRRRGGQLFVTTHSWELLSDPGIGGEETVLLTPTDLGTQARLSSDIAEIRQLLEAGLSVADAALPFTSRPGKEELKLVS